MERPLETVQAASAAPPRRSLLPRQLGFSMLRNTTALGAGRIAIAVCRLLIAGLIVRGHGTATFAEYTLIFGLLAVAEWVADFGTTELFVREISRDAGRRDALLHTLSGLKAFQVPFAFAALGAGLLALRYPRETVEAGLIGGLSLLFLGGVLVCRVGFRVELRMEREVGAELLSVASMVPLVILVTAYGGGLRSLLACHVVSRAIFFGLCLAFGGRVPSPLGSNRAALADAVRSAAAMGLIGFLAGVYESSDVVVLSKLDFAGLAYYSGAQRFVWPVLMALGAVGGTLYPVLSSYWPDARESFERVLQHGVEVVVVLAGLAACALFAGAELFLGLLGRGLEAGAPALRILALLCLVKAVTATVGPVLYVVHGQKAALQFVAVAVAARIVVVATLAPIFSFVGVAWGALFVEVVFAAIPSIRILRRLSGYGIRFGIPARIAVATVLASLGARWLAPGGGVVAVVLALAVYLPLAAWGGAARITELRGLMPTRVA